MPNANKLSSALQVLSGANVEKEQVYLRKIIGFTGMSGTGVTTIALGVAHTLADMGHTVLYVDTRILFPTSYTFLLHKNKYYVNDGDLLSLNEKEYKDIIVETRFKNLWYAYARNRGLLDIVSPRDNFENMAAFLDNVRGMYDFVILDISSEVTDINSASLHEADVIYQVWDENSTSFLNYKRFLSYLCEMGAESYKISNVILNKRSNRLTLPDIFKGSGVRLVATLPGTYTIKDLTWKGLTIRQLASMDKRDELFVKKFNLIIDDLFDRLGETSDDSGIDGLADIDLDELGINNKKSGLFNFRRKRKTVKPTADNRGEGA